MRVVRKKKRPSARHPIVSAKRQRSHKRRTIILSLIAALSMIALIGAGYLGSVVNH